MVTDTAHSAVRLDIPRWGELGDGVARLLMRRPRVADICRYLVLSVPWPTPPTGSVVLRCLDDGYLEVLGWFGYPREVVEAYRRMSLFDDVPLTQAARLRQPVALFNGDDVARDYPQLIQDVMGTSPRAPGALMAVPMVSDLGTIGVLGVSFPGAVDPDDGTLPALVSLSPLLGLYVELTTPPGSASPRPSSVQGDPDDDSTDGAPLLDANGLTKRQLRVLSMLAKKMSNREIALALDYSVSTIRLDTMAIFRYLGVEGRRDAVEEARRRGILGAA